MLSSIHPLGERTRHNRWIITVTAFTVSAAAAGAAVGLALSYAGNWLVGGLSEAAATITIGSLAVLAGIFDVSQVAPPGPKRQVNEHWIGAYRGWVYGGSFGLQLGIGTATFVVTWGVWATLAAELLIGSPLAGLAIGATFGLGRSLAVLLAGRVDRPSRLSAFHSRMADLASPVALVSSLLFGLAGALLVLGAAL